MAKFKVGDKVKFKVNNKEYVGKIRQVMLNMGHQDYDVQLDGESYYTYRFEEELTLVPEVKVIGGIGDKFTDGYETYMLVRCGDLTWPNKAEVVLVNAESGNRWDRPVTARNVHAVTSEEWAKINNSHLLTKVNKEDC